MIFEQKCETNIITFNLFWGCQMFGICITIQLYYFVMYKKTNIVDFYIGILCHYSQDIVYSCFLTCNTVIDTPT